MKSETHRSGSSQRHACPRLVALGFVALTLALVAASTAYAQAPYVVKDYGLVTGGPGQPTNLVAVGNVLFFQGCHYFNGCDLWRSNGTPAATVVVKDVNPGSGSSSPQWLTNVNGTLFFQAYEGTNGTELWKSNGTDAGTVLVKDIRFGVGMGSIPSNLTNLNGMLVFTADDGMSGTELWKSDGTLAGTVLVKNIRPGAGSGSNPSNLTDVNGTLFFTANDGTNGAELWQSDGTTAGTVLVKDIRPDASAVGPGVLTNVNGTLFFAADDGTSGYELWKSDGTATGTVLVKEINPGAGGSLSSPLTNMNGTLFFAADDGTNGVELWKSDGTDSGTVLVKDIRPGGSGSGPNFLTNVDGTLFFTADDGTNGYELWKSDGTDAGTVLVKDIRPGAIGSGPGYLANVIGTLFFTAHDGTTGYELWKSDGTEAGTVLVADIFLGPSSSTPQDMLVVGPRLYFSAADASGRELWALDLPADLAVTKTDGVTTVAPGASVTYTITASNNGPFDAPTAVVSDAFPPVLEGMSWYCQDFGDAGCPDTASGTGSINAVVYLPAGSHVVFTAIGTVSASATGTLSNTANVYSVLPDPNPTNDSATDMDTVVLPTLAVNDVTITEGNAGTSIASFTVTLSPAPPAPVTVNYSTQDVTAQAGSDYVFASGMLTFGIGETSKPIEVTVNGDTQYEPAETLEVVLEVVTSPSSATIGDGTGVLTISNDDTPAGPSRVFVSVLGADTNDCSNIATPCRTLNGAIAQVAEDGEVIVIKSGSYAGATITKGVKIDVASGVVAFSGQTVTVNALFAKVVIRGLTLKALNPGTGFGLLIEAAGAVFVESTVLDGWEVGLRQVGAAELFVKDSMLRNNGLALFAGSGKTSVDSTRFLNNVTGVYAEDSELSLRGSTLSGASSAGVWAGDSSAVVVEKCQISDNASGIYVASTATVGLSRSAVIGNGLGLENAGGTLLVYGNNAVRANATNISGPITPAGLQ